ncbi:MAG: hypothetical protein LBE31_05845, partial [Deltaproteobacteria bacterium]|nr:hypothetical protein [Deltaproteobacteria bacterium]
QRTPRVVRLASSEFKAFWSGSSGGLALAVFLGLGGLWFYNSVAAYALDNLRAMTRGGALDANLALFSGGLANLGLLILIVTPLTTMRAFANSNNGGHFDLLRSWPLSRLELIIGLHLSASSCLGLLVLLGMAPFFALLFMGIGAPMVMLTSAMGLILMVMSLAAIGLAVSSHTRSPLAAALTTLGVLGFMWAIGWAAPYLPESLGRIIQGLAFEQRLNHFVIGLIDLNDIAYFLALTIGALFLTGQIKE